jgi:hypothetical protein
MYLSFVGSSKLQLRISGGCILLVQRLFASDYCFAVRKGLCPVRSLLCRIHSVWEASQATRPPCTAQWLTFQLLPGVTGELHVRNSIKSRYIALDSLASYTPQRSWLPCCWVVLPFDKAHCHHQYTNSAALHAVPGSIPGATRFS